MRRFSVFPVGLLLAVLGLSWTGQAPNAAVRSAPVPPPPSRTDRRGVYLSAPAAAQPGYLETILGKLSEFGLDTVVVDVKNNHGEVCYASGVDLARRIGAVKVHLDLRAVVRAVHARGMYLIARQVVFYDPLLARHLGYDSPWVLPTVPAATAYNLEIAAEVAAAGVDEIQFDYIRFPDDGPIGPDYSGRCTAVEAFLQAARSRLKLPLSADVYGRVTFPWNARKIDPIGQQLEGMARWVDAVSPMVYPSHYVERAFKDDPYGTVHQAVRDARARVETPIRPYLQAFEMAIPPGMTYTTYILEQIRAAEEAGASGYLFWNPRSDYSVLWAALAARGRR
ncbi:MAG: putative glycoside hydrolase [Candidatus Bipolaricaulota bacterium]|nr:putative glycoside hydrolase [Candidatus Bipolaricaulota bacterium]